MRTQNVKVRLGDGEMGAYRRSRQNAGRFDCRDHGDFSMKDRWAQAEVNHLLERRLSPNPLGTIHKYPRADAFAQPTASRRADRALKLTLELFDRHLAADLSSAETCA
jgi:hypothetical protein